MSIRIFISTVWWSGRFFKLTNSHMLIHKVTGWIQIDIELHVKPFYKGCSVPLPQWFRQVQDCWLLRKSMFENFAVYLESCTESISPTFDELQKHMFTKKPLYSAKIKRYAILSRCAFIQSYQILLEYFPLLPFSLLHKISSGTIDAV